MLGKTIEQEVQVTNQLEKQQRAKIAASMATLPELERKGVDENKEIAEQVALTGELQKVESERAESNLSEAKTFGQELKSIQAGSIKGFISQGIAAAISQALAFIPPPFNLIAAGTAATAAIGLFNKLVPQSFARGTKYVGSDGLAMIHQGEEIRTKGGVIRDNNGGSGQLVAVVSGSDLHFVLDRFNTTRGNSL
jgi:hypothetical protein